MNQSLVKIIENDVCEKYQNSKRLNHILGVAKLAKKLALIHNLDSEKAYLVGLLHDYCKYESIDEMKQIIADEGVIAKFENAPQIYHAYASSVMAKEKFGIMDEEILNAIKYHVYGRVGMSLFEKIIVLSDFCEENRTYPRCVEVREVLENGQFDLAIYLCIKYTIEAVLNNGNTPLSEQYEILKELENNIGV